MDACKEVKRTFFGIEIVANCYLKKLENGTGILKYYFDNNWNVGGLILQPPMYTLAYYSEKKPYNIYCWFTESHQLIAYYINIVDNTHLQTKVFFYRDLIVDILVYPDHSFKVLDEHEIPSTIDQKTLDFIMNTKCEVIDHLDEIIRNVKHEMEPFSVN